ncbi:hypothetical protein FDUTEX481_00526 [Tolypothrix sp. PCC 7601]|nr:hypothetical protein FDUTEX481_00526 [Tolypothrix sp. PCC 7601]
MFGVCQKSKVIQLFSLVPNPQSPISSPQSPITHYPFLMYDNGGDKIANKCKEYIYILQKPF